MIDRADADRLIMWHADRRVGELWRSQQDRIGFVYDQDWLDQGFAIGHTLPLRGEPFAPDDGVAHAWFFNGQDPQFFELPNRCRLVQSCRHEERCITSTERIDAKLIGDR